MVPREAAGRNPSLNPCSLSLHMTAGSKGAGRSLNQVYGGIQRKQEGRLLVLKEHAVKWGRSGQYFQSLLRADYLNLLGH